MRRFANSSCTSHSSTIFRVHKRFFSVTQPLLSISGGTGTAASSTTPTMTFSEPILLEKAMVPADDTAVVGGGVVPAQRVLILPILHAATREFYDETLMKIHTVLRGVPPASASAESNDDGGGGDSSSSSSSSLKSKTMDGSSVALLNGKSSQGFMHTVLVEGVNGSQQDIAMQREEWLRASTNVEDAQLLANAATQYASYYEQQEGRSAAATHIATPFDDLVRAYCNEYSLKFPLPPGVLLEDYYFKPLLAALAGHCLVNSDVVLSEMHPTLQQLVASQGLGCAALSSYRNSRFVDAVMANTSLTTAVKKNEAEADESSSSGTTADENKTNNGSGGGGAGGIDSPWDQEAFPNGRQVTALWGHLHVPRVVELLKGMHGFKELKPSAVITNNKEEENGGVNGVEVSRQVLKTISYGWDPVKHTLKD